MFVTYGSNTWDLCCEQTLRMSDEGDESDSGERGHLSESPSPPLSLCVPRDSPSPARPLDLFSSASPLLGDIDPPYLASPECLHASPENRTPRDIPHLSPTKFLQDTEDVVSPIRPRRNVRLDAGYGHDDDPFPKWRGRRSANVERFQHREEGFHQAPGVQEQRNHYSAEHIPEFSSDITWVIRGFSTYKLYSLMKGHIISCLAQCSASAIIYAAGRDVKEPVVSVIGWKSVNNKYKREWRKIRIWTVAPLMWGPDLVSDTVA